MSALPYTESLRVKVTCKNTVVSASKLYHLRTVLWTDVFAVMTADDLYKTWCTELSVYSLHYCIGQYERFALQLSLIIYPGVLSVVESSRGLQ